MPTISEGLVAKHRSVEEPGEVHPDGACFVDLPDSSNLNLHVDGCSTRMFVEPETWPAGKASSQHRLGQIVP